MDSNRVDCLVEKSGLGVEPRLIPSPIKQCGFRYIKVCSVVSALRSGRIGRWFESTHPDHLLCLKMVNGTGHKVSGYTGAVFPGF